MTAGQSLASKIAKLNEFLGEIDHLRTLRYDNSEMELWRDKVRDALRLWFGEQSQEYQRFQGPMSFSHPYDDPAKQRQYDDNLTIYETELKSVIQLLEMRQEYVAESAEDDTVELMPFLRIFIVHDGPTGARSKLEDFIRALGAVPVTAENEPSKGRQVSQKVDAVMSTCGYAVALATKARASRQDGKHLARANVTNELPRVRKLLGDRWMVVLQHGVELPSNESGFVYERFSPQSMDQVFLALVRELRGHDILQLRPPSTPAQTTSP